MSEIPNVPLSRVVMRTSGGGTPERDNPDLWNGGIPWASVKDFKDGLYRLSTTKEQISAKGLKRSASHLIPAGTPIICTRMAVGRIARADVPVAINQDLRALFISDDFDTDYVVWAVDAIRHQIEKLAIGSTVKGISIDQLLSFEIGAPPKPEQTKIAEILSTVDRAIEQTEALIAKQQRLKTGLMQDLLTRGIDEHGNLRSEQTHKFKDSPLGRIPVEWEVKYIGEVFEIQLGKMLSQKATEGISPFPYLGNKNVQWDRVEVTDLQMMDFNVRERNKFELRPGDILMCEGGEVGRTCLWRGEVENCYYQKAIHRLRPVDKGYLPELFPRYMRWGIRRGILADFTSQTSIAHLTLEKLATVPIIVPPICDQILIAQGLDSLDKKLENLSVTLNKFRSLKTALMQDLLTGRMRVTKLLHD